MNSNVNQSKTSDWVSWEFKRQRPDKVPGCQDVASLPHLEEGEIFCGEGQHCFYFSCGKCSSLLALDTLNPGYKNRMQYVPRISCIPAPEAFTEDNRYHGEIHEMYRRHFAQISDLRGVAINGWNNKNAKKLFSNVDDTFRSWEKMKNTKDFEIDWILFNGATITVIEVMEKSKTSIKENGNSFKKKLEQIKKDRIIIQHLLEVCGCKNTRVNYVIACPNVSITEVTEGNFLKNHTRFFEKIIETGDRLGFIAEDCMITGDVYIYKKETSTVEKTSFSEMIGSPDNVSRSHLWERSYSLVTSSVVLSVLFVRNVIDSSSEHLVPDDRNFELKQNEKITRSLCRDMPDVARKNFPELLVFGPEQLKVIQEIKRYKKCILVGEAGCGKTFILLYLLYQNTSKHLRENECKNVVFGIPKQKTELKAFVEKFVEDFCNRNFVHIPSIYSFDDITFIQGTQLFLFDEIYALQYPSNSDQLSLAGAKIVVAQGLLDDDRFPSISPRLFSSDWGNFYLRSSYRNPSNISSFCRKLRLLADRETNPTWHIQLDRAVDSSLKVNDEDSILIKHTDYCSEIGKEIAERKEKTLLVADDENAFKSEFLNDYTLRVHVNFNKYSLDVRNLSFTGVQYKNVVILLMTSRSVNKKAVLTLLYHSISRSTHHVTLLTPNPEFYKTLLAATPADLKVFEKLRRSQNVPKEDLLLLNSEEKSCEAVVLTVLTENWSMLDSLIETFSSRPDASILWIGTIRILLKALPHFENGEILNIMSKNFSDKIDIQQKLKIYIELSKTLNRLPNASGKRRLLEPFMILWSQRTWWNSFLLTEKNKWSYKALNSMALSQLTDDDYYVDLCSQFYPRLPEDLKELFKWDEQSPEKIITLRQAEQLFTEFSALRKKEIEALREEREKWSEFVIPGCKIATKMADQTYMIKHTYQTQTFSGSVNYRQTLQSAFCSFFKNTFGSLFCNCWNFLQSHSNLRYRIKDQALITTDVAIYFLESFIISNIMIVDSESRANWMRVLLAIIYMNILKSTTRQLTRSCYESNY